MSITRENIKTNGIWTLQRRVYSSGEYDYVIQVDSKTAVDLFINDYTNYKTGHTVYTVEYTPSSRMMELDEAAKFVEHAQQALVAATEFQQAIDAAESN